LDGLDRPAREDLLLKTFHDFLHHLASWNGTVFGRLQDSEEDD